jgi:hypothetical protein
VGEEHRGGLVGPSAVQVDRLCEREGGRPVDELGVLDLHCHVVKLAEVLHERDEVREVVAGLLVVEGRVVVEDVVVVGDIGHAVALAGDATQ